jgi:ADP-ribose pyrophosphatase YjhB (NUDIX family)
LRSPRIELRVPEGDNLPRFVCADCGTIHYQNPKIVVGCLPEWQGRVLLCKRAIEPRYGLWTLPAGFLENGETIVAGALRETLEEARARVEPGDLYTVISLPQINQVYMMFRARLLDLDFGPGDESLDVKLYERRTFRGKRWHSGRSPAHCATTFSIAGRMHIPCASVR